MEKMVVFANNKIQFVLLILQDVLIIIIKLLHNSNQNFFLPLNLKLLNKKLYEPI